MTAEQGAIFLAILSTLLVLFSWAFAATSYDEFVKQGTPKPIALLAAAALFFLCVPIVLFFLCKMGTEKVKK